MPSDSLRKLATLLVEKQEELLVSWRLQVRKLPPARRLDTPSLNDHIPTLLGELVAALREAAEEPTADSSAAGCSRAHGIQRARDHFDIEEVVTEYSLLRRCIYDLADKNALILHWKSFHVVNCVLDKSIGWAVQTFAAEKALEVQQRREEHLAFIAHDLRTPLNAISLAARVLDVRLQGHDTRPQLAPMLRTLDRNVRHLEALVSKVLGENIDLQVETSMKLERREFDLWAFVEGILHEMQPIAVATNTQLVNGVPEELVVYADASFLRRIFQNLLANAIKHTPRGQVVISALRNDADGRVECQVRDNGAGISADRIHRIFNKFESDSQEEGGLGLGLAIVKRVVEAHGGEVRVESAPGLGSTFQFILPPKSSGPP